MPTTVRTVSVVTDSSPTLDELADFLAAAYRAGIPGTAVVTDLAGAWITALMVRHDVPLVPRPPVEAPTEQLPVLDA